MSSSTSSSKRRGDLLVVLFAALAILAVEGVTHTVLFKASRDLSRFSTYQKKAEELGKAKGLRIALIGNSAMQKGVEPSLLVQELEAAGLGPVAVEAFATDASRINMWNYVYAHLFETPHVGLDVAIFPYYSHILEDSNELELGRLGLFFTSLASWPEVFAHEVTALGKRAEFIVSSVWAFYAARERIKERLLLAITPGDGYKDFVRRITSSQLHCPLVAAKTADNKAGYTSLSRLLVRLGKGSVLPVIVAFPLRDLKGDSYYPLPVQAVGMTEAAGGVSIDLRVVKGLIPDLYEDNIHLGTDGQRIFTTRLARELVPVLRTLQRSRFGKPHINGEETISGNKNRTKRDV